METPPPLSYASPNRSGDAQKIFWFYFVLNLVVCFAMLGLPLFVLPRFHSIIEQSRTTPPAITAWVFNGTDWAVHHFGWALIPLTTAWSAAMALLYARCAEHARQRRFLSLALLLIYLGILVTLMVAVLAP